MTSKLLTIKWERFTYRLAKNILAVIIISER